MISIAHKILLAREHECALKLVRQSGTECLLIPNLVYPSGETRRSIAIVLMILKGYDHAGAKRTTRCEKAAVKLVFKRVNGFKIPSPTD
jgi:hypothetical protein